MSQLIPLVEITEILGTNLINVVGKIHNECATGVTTDSRSLNSGELFLALVGENFDGHDFANKAVEKGAIALLVSRQLSNIKNIPQFIVGDTLKAYQQIAHWWRNTLDIPIIAVTGSVGKTTTKELITAVLNTQGKVLKTEKNYNNEIGVPKTLLQITKEHNYAVIEMGMRGLGEIALLSQIARPTIGVITNVGTAHIGRLGSVEAIARAKCELLAQMPKDSIAILNYDNSLLIETAKKVWQGKTITYGFNGGDILGKIDPENILTIDNKDYPLPLPGVHNASNYLAAIAVAKALEIDINKLTSGLNVELPKGRSRRYKLKDNIIILDETYNAGLESTIASLEMLKATSGTRKIAVLGTMKELGSYSAQLHRQVGEKINELGIDLLFVLADEPETEEIIIKAKVERELFKDLDKLANRLLEIMTTGDRILLKASNSVGLNKVVDKLINNE